MRILQVKVRKKGKSERLQTYFRTLKVAQELRTVDLLEGEPVDDDPEVVEEGEADDHGPVVAQPSRGIENERPVWGPGAAETPGAHHARVTAASPLLLLLLQRVPPGIDKANFEVWIFSVRVLFFFFSTNSVQTFCTSIEK